MFTKRVLPIAALLAALYPIAGAAADDADLKSLREELKTLRDTYQQRIDALEKRLSDAEAKSDKAADAAARADRAALAAGQRQSGENAFNPAISLILSGMYSNLGQDPQATPYRIAGFIPSNGDVAPTPRSFNLGESELAFSANVDQVFRGQLTVSLPPGRRLADGRGRLHPDARPGPGLHAQGRTLPLRHRLHERTACPRLGLRRRAAAYKALLGGQMKQRRRAAEVAGARPTLLGRVRRRGRPRRRLSRPPTATRTAPRPARCSPTSAATSASPTAGAPDCRLLGTSPRDRTYDDIDAPATSSRTMRSPATAGPGSPTASGNGRPNGNDSQEHSLIVQGEYFRRREDGTLGLATSAAPTSPATTVPAQSGCYAQAV